MAAAFFFVSLPWQRTPHRSSFYVFDCFSDRPRVQNSEDTPAFGYNLCKVYGTRNAGWNWDALSARLVGPNAHLYTVTSFQFILQLCVEFKIPASTWWRWKLNVNKATINSGLKKRCCEPLTGWIDFYALSVWAHITLISHSLRNTSKLIPNDHFYEFLLHIKANFWGALMVIKPFRFTSFDVAFSIRWRKISSLNRTVY